MKNSMALRLALALVVSAAGLLVGRNALASEDPPAPSAPITVLLMRHAEAEPATAAAPDPGLTEAGARRAEELARLCAKSGVTHLFSSELKRTFATLAPLAEDAELEVRRISAKAPEEQVARLRALPPGSVAVVVGHSNTVPAMVAALGGTLEGLEEHPQYGRMFPHDEYGRLIVLQLPADGKGPVHPIRLQVGE